MSLPSGRPEAATFQVQRLVERVLLGEARIPPFQRGFRWGAEDVLDLLDSVYRGFPIGTLLLWKKPAEAAGLDLGPLHIDAPAMRDALWVVDGQQRLTSLVAVLACPEAVRPEHRKFEVFFDLAARREDPASHARSGRFRHRPHEGPVPPSWLPMSVIVRPETLDEWVDAHLSDRELRKLARQVSTAFREYGVPAYIVTAGDEHVVKTMFDRTNNTGKRLEKDEVFNALHGGGQTPSDLGALAAALDPLRFGQIDPKWLLKTLFALRDKDVTQIQAKRLRDLRAEDLGGALADTEKALERAIVFLRRDADIPHIELLPYRFPLLVLARFFHAHEAPLPRSRALLARWVWAGAITGEHRAEKIPYVRQALRAMRGEEGGEPPGEEESVQRLLSMVTWRSPAETAPVDVAHFRFGTAEARLWLLALSALRPRHVVGGAPLDVGPLLATKRGAAMLHLVPLDAPGLDVERWRHHLANRVLHPPFADGTAILEHLAASADDVLRSHAFDARAAAALRAGDRAAMLEARAAHLLSHVTSHLDRHARWIEPRRMSMKALLGRDAGDDHEP